MALHRSVLLVDDNEADNLIHREVIEEAGFAEKVYVASDGRDAIDFLTSQQPDEEGYFPPEVIFLDIHMPVMDGFEFLEAYEELPEELRRATVVVMLTSSLNPSDKARADQHAYVKGYLTKSLDEEQLAMLGPDNLARR